MISTNGSPTQPVNGATTNRRVLLVAKGLDLGGTERVVTDLAIHLNQRSVDAAVVVVNGSRDALLPLLRGAEVSVDVLHGGDRIGLRGLLGLRRLIAHGGFHVVHAHGPLTIVATRIAARQCMLVGTLHSMWPSMRRSSRLLLRLVCRSVPLVAVSERVRASMPSPLRENTRIIGHGVDLARAGVERASAQRCTSDGVRVVTVARHRRAKNYENLLQAIALARAAGADVRLTAYGEGPRLGRHRQRAEQLGIAPYVRFEPPRPDVVGAIAECDLFVLASDTEGQPIVLIEAMAAGRPVIATTVGRAPDLITADIGLLVPPADSRKLADAIRTLSSDPARRASMGKAALAAADDCSIDRAVSGHVRLYDEAVHEQTVATRG